MLRHSLAVELVGALIKLDICIDSLPEGSPHRGEELLTPNSSFLIKEGSLYQ